MADIDCLAGQPTFFYTITTDLMLPVLASVSELLEPGKMCNYRQA